MNNEEEFIIKRISATEISTNVPHLISWHSPSDFSNKSEFNFGYMGTGPHELSANILWVMDVFPEKECLAWASKFSEEVLNYLPNQGGKINKSEVNDWIKSKNIKQKNV